MNKSQLKKIIKECIRAAVASRGGKDKINKSIIDAINIHENTQSTSKKISSDYIKKIIRESLKEYFSSDSAENDMGDMDSFGDSDQSSDKSTSGNNSRDRVKSNETRIKQIDDQINLLNEKIKMLKLQQDHLKKENMLIR